MKHVTVGAPLALVQAHFISRLHLIQVSPQVTPSFKPFSILLSRVTRAPGIVYVCPSPGFWPYLLIPFGLAHTNMSHSCRDRQLSHLRMLFAIPGTAPTIIHLSLPSSFTTHLKPQCPLEVPAPGACALRHSDDFFVTTCISRLKLCVGLSHSIPNFLRAGTRWYLHICPHTLVAYHNVSDFNPALMFLKTEKKRRGRERERRTRKLQICPALGASCLWSRY